jgi:hypothetical protein
MILPVGEYEIPEDCTAQVHHRVVYVVKKLPLGRRLGTQRHKTKHCRDCRHRVDGFATNTSTHKTKVCELRPKVVMGWYKKRDTYYAAGDYDPICDKFKENEIEL